MDASPKLDADQEPRSESPKWDEVNHSGFYDIQRLSLEAKERAQERRKQWERERASYFVQTGAAGALLPLAGRKNEAFSSARQVARPAASVPSDDAALSKARESLAASQESSAVHAAPAPRKSSRLAWGIMVVGCGLIAAAALTFARRHNIAADDSQASAQASAFAVGEDESADHEKGKSRQQSEIPSGTAPKVTAIAPVEGPESRASGETVSSPKVENPKAKPSKKPSSQPGKARPAQAQRKSKAKSKSIDAPTPKLNTDKPKGVSLDDVLTSVSGGAATSKSSASSEPVPTKPTKARLDRSDVASAMAKVSPKALKCHSVESYVGTVAVKFTVTPEGKISKAAALAPHGSSKTGACVVRSVKNASFSAFNGRPTSFTFPFLLAQ